MTMRQRLQYLDMCSRGTNYHDNKWEKENSNVGRGTILQYNIGCWNAWTAGGSIGCREITTRLSNFSHASKVILPECKVSITLQTKWWGNSLQQSPARPNIRGHGGGNCWWQYCIGIGCRDNNETVQFQPYIQGHSSWYWWKVGISLQTKRWEPTFNHPCDPIYEVVGGGFMMVNEGCILRPPIQFLPVVSSIGAIGLVRLPHDIVCCIISANYTAERTWSLYPLFHHWHPPCHHPPSPPNTPAHHVPNNYTK